MTLLQTIEASAIDSKVPVADLLRQCKVLAARLKNQELAEWATRELEGYPAGIELPSYRTIALPNHQGHFVGGFGAQMKNAPIPLGSLPAELREALNKFTSREPISNIEQLAMSSDVLQMPWPADVVAHVANKYPLYENMVLVAAMRPVSTASLRGVVDTVRTRILDFVLKIQADNPDAGDAPVNAAQAPIPPSRVTQYFNTTIVGGLANIGSAGASIGSGNTATGTTGATSKDREKVEKLVTKLKEEVKTLPKEKRAEARAAVTKMAKHATKDAWDPRKLKAYVDLYATVATVITPTVHELGNMLAPLLAHHGW